MPGVRTLAGSIVVLAVGAAPAAAAADNAAPRILSAKASEAPDRAVRVVVVGRDRDDVVRGAEVSWGDAGPEQGLSACEQSSRRAERRRRGRRERFELAHAYAAPGHYTVTVRVLSGGCGKRPPQRSAARTLTVHVESRGEPRAPAGAAGRTAGIEGGPERRRDTVLRVRPA